MASRICWHCKTKTHMHRMNDPFPTQIIGDRDKPITWFAWYTCDECHYASLAECTITPDRMIDRYKYDDQVSLENRRGAFKGAAKAAASCWFDNDENLTWYPQVGHGKEYPDVNEPIASAASEAYSCYYINSYRAAILMARTTLEAIAKDKNITKGTLQAKIEQMGEQNIISPQLKDEAHEIRFLGNEMAHGDLKEPVSEDDAADILGFMDTMIDYVYQQPQAIQRRRILRKERKTS